MEIVFLRVVNGPIPGVPPEWSIGYPATEPLELDDELAAAFIASGLAVAAADYQPIPPGIDLLTE